MFRRIHYFTEKKYQIKYILAVILPIIIVTVVFTLIVYFALVDIMNQELSGAVTKGVAFSIAHGLMYRFMIWIILLLLLCGLGGIYFSHKVIGPVYRMERALQDVADGDLTVHMKLRQGDRFLLLSESINRIIEKQRGDIIRERGILEETVSRLDKLDSELKNPEIREIRDILKELLKGKGSYKTE